LALLSGIFGICTVKKKKREEKDNEETEEDGEKVEFEKVEKSWELFRYYMFSGNLDYIIWELQCVSEFCF
jgi:hypothetical protein